MNQPQYLQNPYFYQHHPSQWPPPPAPHDDLFKFRFATSQLGLLVRGAEIILSTIYPWVDPQLRAQIDEWFCRKEECVACIAGADNQPLDHLYPSDTSDGQKIPGNDHQNQGNQELETRSSRSSESQEEKLNLDDSELDESPASSIEKSFSEETDSDEDLDDESDGSNTEALIDNLETKFRGILDEKILETEAFFDQIGMSGTSQNLSETKDMLDEKGNKSGEICSVQLGLDSDQIEEEGEDDAQSVDSGGNLSYAKIPSRLSSLPLRSKSDGEIYYRPYPRQPKKSLSVWDTGYDMSPVEKIDKCLTDLQAIMSASSGKECEGVKSCSSVPEDIQKSVVQLILTARSVLQGSQSPLPIDNDSSPSNAANCSVVGILTEKAKTESVHSSNGKHVESQTDDLTFIDPRISMQPTEEPEIARSEIGNLRDARMSLVLQRKDFSDRLKQAGPEDSVKGEERRIYEFEEAIEAIDTAIEYKNEIILGNKCVLSSQSAPGKNEADLVTRLTSLSLFDLQRLLCKYFSKVVELRFSSTKLEKALEKLEADKEKLSRRVAADHKFIKERDEDHEFRIKLFLSQCNKDPNSAIDSHLRSLEKALSVAKRKQYDLETSLTELLVRHGYLLNGADYDVKQVVRMLGIDTVQMGLNWRDGKMQERRKREGKVHYSGLIPEKVFPALESGPPGQGLSRRMKEASSQRRNAQSSSSHHHHPQPLIDLSRRGHSSRHPEPEPLSTVRRHKKKLIIQPSQPSSSHHNQHH